MMKNKRLSAKKVEHKILGEEADKLKDKLDSLKEQIRLKKQQKQMNKTSTSAYSTHSNARPASRQLKSQTQSSFNQQAALHEVLANLKIENIEGKLRDKNIQSLGQLKSVKVEDVDQWKDIPVGYRIKIKKYLQSVKDKEGPSQQKNQQTPSDRPKVEEVPNIQSIIENRKQLNKFVPISRIKDVESEGEAEQELEQQEQEKMMLSIMEAFGGRKRASSIKDKQKKTTRKSVHWSPLVDELQKNSSHIKQYPKERINKKIFDIVKQTPAQQTPLQAGQMKVFSLNTTTDNTEFPDYKYCWICLKKIQQGTYCQQSRQFCSKKCFNTYEQTINYDLIAAADNYVEEPSNKQNPKEEQEETFEVSFDIV